MKVIEDVERYDDTVEYSYDYQGYLVVIIKEADKYSAILIWGSYLNPMDRPVPEIFYSKAEAKAAAEKMIDDEIEAQIAWEEAAGLYQRETP